MSDQLSTVSNQEARKHRQTLSGEKTGPLTTTAIMYGVVAGILMSLFVSVSGFYITGENAGFGFLKLIILGAALYPLLARTKAATAAGQSVKNAIPTGLMAGAAAGVVSSLAILFFNAKEVVSGAAEGVADAAGNQFVLAGINFVTCLVAALIFSLIFMQLLKDNRPAK